MRLLSVGKDTRWTGASAPDIAERSTRNVRCTLPCTIKLQFDFHCIGLNTTLLAHRLDNWTPKALAKALAASGTSSRSTCKAHENVRLSDHSTRWIKRTPTAVVDSELKFWTSWYRETD